MQYPVVDLPSLITHALSAFKYPTTSFNSIPYILTFYLDFPWATFSTFDCARWMPNNVNNKFALPFRSPLEISYPACNPNAFFVVYEAPLAWSVITRTRATQINSWTDIFTYWDVNRNFSQTSFHSQLTRNSTLQKTTKGECLWFSLLRFKLQ